MADDGETPNASGQNLANLRPACAVDAIVVYNIKEKRRRDVPMEIEVSETARVGEPCAAASDKSSCEGTLKNIAFPRRAGFGTGGGRTFLVVSRGGKLELVSDREQLAGLVGPVDSKQDAAALLWLDGWRGTCSKLQAQGSAFVVPKDDVGLLCPGMRPGNQGAHSIPDIPEGYEKEGKYRLKIDRQGKLQVTYLGGAPKEGDEGFGRMCGRRPIGMRLMGPHAYAEACPSDDVRGAEVGVYLAEGAELEAAAVIAFELLASELAAHGAPEALIERCRIAAEDERRHTRLMTEAARRYGVEPAMPAPMTRTLPTLRELARENTIEGCVRETWGALSAALQARTAQDPLLAAMYASIAPDELAHAELAWDLQEWLTEQTGDAPRLEAIAVTARDRLFAELVEPTDAVAALTGAPYRTVACELIRQLAA